MGIAEGEIGEGGLGAVFRPISMQCAQNCISKRLFWVGFPGGSDGNESACTLGKLDVVPGLERFPREGNGNPL